MKAACMPDSNCRRWKRWPTIRRLAGSASRPRAGVNYEAKVSGGKLEGRVASTRDPDDDPEEANDFTGELTGDSAPTPRWDRRLRALQAEVAGKLHLMGHRDKELAPLLAEAGKLFEGKEDSPLYMEMLSGFLYWMRKFPDEGVLDHVGQHHLGHPLAPEIIVNSAWRLPHADTQAFYDRLLKDDKMPPQARAAVHYALANRLDEGEGKMAEALPHYEKTASCEARIPFFGRDLRQLAEQRIRAIKLLAIGMPAPEIEGKDSAGKSFKLSDYKGKVVLLDFWGHW